MRSDMKKVIVTPPRHGGKWDEGRKFRENNQLHRDPESLPTKESMRKKHRSHWSGKEFSDFLAPLRRFLEKNVGRPWNKVYSEICEHADSRSLTGWHLRTHVEMEIERNVIKDGKKIYYCPQYYRGVVELRRDELYVDPDDGLLKMYKRGKRFRYKHQAFSHLSLPEKFAIYADKYSVGATGNPKHCELECRDGRLFMVTWYEGKEHLKNYTPCSAAQAERDFSRYTPRSYPPPRRWMSYNRSHGDYCHKLYAMIRRNLKEALKSNEPYIKRMAELVERKERERNKERPTPEEILAADKQQRKAI